MAEKTDIATFDTLVSSRRNIGGSYPFRKGTAKEILETLQERQFFYYFFSRKDLHQFRVSEEKNWSYFGFHDVVPTVTSGKQSENDKKPVSLMT